MDINDTICAIATPPGPGGIGIVRISGVDSKKILEAVWDGVHRVSSFESHKMYYGKVVSPRTKVAIDTVLAVLMQSPHSYTGEDVVEISCHGGQVVLEKILEACRQAGARLALPGEFTRRAFLNGKMDLAQAEAVADLIAATSEEALKCARVQLDGSLSNEIDEVTSQITNLCAFVEAAIDFPEEDIDFIEKEGIEKRLEAVAKKIGSLAASYSEGRIFREGVNVTIVGRPNVGKSSLFNALVGHDRAIVHHTSGTTRDLVTETIQIKGVAFHLTDAAGLWDSNHDVEKLGIEKARDALARAEMVLFVLDGSQPIGKEDFDIYDTLDSKRTIICVNKADLSECNIPLLCKEGQGEEAVKISAIRGDGIDTLKETLIQRFKVAKTGHEGVIITAARHKEALDEAAGYVKKAIEAINQGKSPEFIAHHLNLTQDALGRITGRTYTEDILDRIFSHFCIGK